MINWNKTYLNAIEEMQKKIRKKLIKRLENFGEIELVAALERSITILN